MSIPQPFYGAEQQPLSVSGTSGSVTFTSTDQYKWPHVRIVNYGSAGCQVNIQGGTAVATASAAGTTQHYVGAGEDVIFKRQEAGSGNLSATMSAITDSSTTSIVFEIGQGT